MFERPGRGERAILVGTVGGDEDARFAEFAQLADSAGAEVVAAVHGNRPRPDPRYYIGHGKALEVAAAVTETGADLVLVDHGLSPSQERNLESLVRCRVLDRAGLILDIFAQRARSHEGKLQVELAQLEHLTTRLVRGWTHLERQKGGIGLRGPGEKQLESDRRLLGQRIKQIRRRLARVRGQRQQGRLARRRAEVPTVALVGYTNAGKSTLFNRLAHADVLVEDRLFATLDPTMRQLRLPNGTRVVLADTVGFISELPHSLIDAFRATLEEVREADLLLHVVDAADEERSAHVADVDQVLEEIQAAGVPKLLVMNKIDLMNARPAIDFAADGTPERIWMSAAGSLGEELLLRALEMRCGAPRLRGHLTLAPAQGQLRGWLYARGAVVQEEVTGDGGWVLQLDVEAEVWRALAQRSGVDPAALAGATGERLAEPAEATYNARFV